MQGGRGEAEREKHLTLKGEMLVKFKPYLICDTLVNNCPRGGVCGGEGTASFHLSPVGGGSAALNPLTPPNPFTIFTNFNKAQTKAAAEAAAILSNSISWLRQRRTSTGNRKAVTPHPCPPAGCHCSPPAFCPQKNAKRGDICSARSHKPRRTPPQRRPCQRVKGG